MYTNIKNEAIDYCKTATQPLLLPNMDVELNKEALEWRNSLGKKIEIYLNVEQEFSLKNQPNKSAEIIDLSQSSLHF